MWKLLCWSNSSFSCYNVAFDDTANNENVIWRSGCYPHVKLQLMALPVEGFIIVLFYYYFEGKPTCISKYSINRSDSTDRNQSINFTFLIYTAVHRWAPCTHMHKCIFKDTHDCSCSRFVWETEAGKQSETKTHTDTLKQQRGGRGRRQTSAKNSNSTLQIPFFQTYDISQLS